MAKFDASEKKFFSEKFLSILSEVQNLKSKPEAQKFFYQKLVEIGQKERILNLYRCADKQTKRKVWFRPNQEQLIYFDNQSNRDLILKPRQIGFTELTVKIGLDNCFFKPGSAEGLMAHRTNKAGELFQRIRDTFDWFVSDWGQLIEIETNRDSAKKIIFEKINGIEIKTSYEVSSDFRSNSLTRLHISEASRVAFDNAMGSIDSVPQQGQIIMETTANGRDPVFYSRYRESKESIRKNDVYVWKIHFFPWYKHYPEPGNDIIVPQNIKLDEKELILKSLGVSNESICWRRWKIIEQQWKDKPEIFDEEFPTDDESCFLGGMSVVPRKYLIVLDKWIRNPIRVGRIEIKDSWLEVIEDETGYLSIWETPQLGEQYVIGADPSEGVGKDRSAAFVKRRSTGKYVARIHSSFLAPEDFAKTLYLLARYYNYAFICFELNNHGFVLRDRLYNTYKYANLYHRRDLDDLSNDWRDTVGWRNTRQEKERVVGNFVSRLREGKLVSHCEDLLTECTNFQRDETGRLGATSGSHDDLFIAACLTEEMEDALGPYRENDFDEDDKLNPLTGFPL